MSQAKFLPGFDDRRADGFPIDPWPEQLESGLSGHTMPQCVDASAGDPVKAIRELTGGGVEYAFEAIGLPATMRQAYDSLRKRGMAVVVGVTPMTAEVSVPVMSLVYEERILTGSVYGSSRPSIDIPKLIALYRTGKLKLDELLTRRYPFAQINEAYDALERGEVARSVVTF